MMPDLVALMTRELKKETSSPLFKRKNRTPAKYVNAVVGATAFGPSAKERKKQGDTRVRKPRRFLDREKVLLQPLPKVVEEEEGQRVRKS
jgi:hypothetical protein